MTSITRRIFRYVYSILAVPFCFVLVNALPTSCGYQCGNGAQRISQIVNMLTLNGLIPRRIWLFLFPVWIVSFLIIKAFQSEKYHELKVILAMYVSIFAPILVIGPWFLNIVGPTHPIDVNDAWFQGLIYGSIWTMLVFVFSGIARSQVRKERIPVKESEKK
jgi:hypothetical protein